MFKANRAPVMAGQNAGPDRQGASAGRIASLVLGALLWLLAVGLGAPAEAAGFAPGGALAAARDYHTATLLPSGKLLVAGGIGSSGILASTELYDSPTNTWSAAGALATARYAQSATLLPSGKLLVTGGFGSSGYLASAELYDPATNTWSAAGTLATARSRHTATLLPSGQVLVAGGVNNSGSLASAELYDPATNTWSAAGSLATASELHTAALLPSGKVLVAGGVGNTGYLASAELYDPATNTWSAAGTLATARYQHTATLLPSGKLLVTGGYNNGGYLASAELYDPATNTWSAAGTLATARSRHTATLLPSGKVLVPGGYNNGGYLASTELYDPATNTWSAAGAMAAAREYHTATLLPSGKLLVAAGGGSSGVLASTELYDPATNSWSAAGTLATTRYAQIATLLPSGKLLVAGGVGGGGSALASAELYDPATNTWSAAGTLATARFQHTATLLPSGKVLVAGGFSGSGYLASAELYDPATNTWLSAGTLATARTYHTATLLPSGKVLVAGGGGTSGYLASAELYDPATNTWSAAGALATARYEHTATLLPSGQLLVAAGGGSSGSLASAELYDPATNTWSAAGSLATARELHTATLLPSGKVLVAAGIAGIGGSLASAELYDPATNTWSAAGSLATARYFHTATLLPSGKVLVVGGDNANAPLASVESYDPATNAWSAAGTLATAREYHTTTLLPSGQVLVAGGFGSSNLSSAELYDPGLAPLASLRPALSAVSSFLLQTSLLAATSPGSSTDASGAVTATGFVPLREGSGGATNNSATNLPVFQVQRLDNDQMRFIANDETVNLSDTTFTGSASALAGFPAGPVRVRVWVNGVPSAAQYSNLAVSPYPLASAPSASGGLRQATVTFSPSNYDGGAPIAAYLAIASPGGATASCSAPCSSISFNPITAGTYTFTVAAINAAGLLSSASPPSNIVTVTAAQSTTTTITSIAPSPAVVGQSYTVSFSVAAASATPTGTVSVSDDQGASCGPVTLSSGSGSCALASSVAGNRTLTVSYTPDSAGFLASTGTATQIVNALINQPPTFTLGSNPVWPAGTAGLKTLAGFAQVTSFGSPAESAQSVLAWHVSVSSDPGGVMNGVQIQNDGTLVYALTGQAGIAVISVTCQDNGGTANGGNDTSAPQTFQISVGQGLDLAISMTAGSDFFDGGLPADYTIMVQNIGTTDAHNAIVQDLLPANLLAATWTCDTIGAATCTASGSGNITDTVTIPKNAGVIYHLTATVQAIPELAVSNTATVTPQSGDVDVNTANNSASLTNAVGIFRNGFESAAAPQIVTVPADQAQTQTLDLDLARVASAALLEDQPISIVLLRDAADSGAALVQLRNHRGATQVRLSGCQDDGLWQPGDWMAVDQSAPLRLAWRSDRASSNPANERIGLVDVALLQNQTPMAVWSVDAQP